jgi:predicted kinase
MKVGPALEELGAIIVAPDSVRGKLGDPHEKRAAALIQAGVFDEALQDCWR